MDSEFWGCFKCGDFLRGSTSQIQEYSTNHQSICVNSSSEYKNIGKIIEGLQKYSAQLPTSTAPPPPPLPPPPPPQPANSLLNSKEMFLKKKILNKASNQRVNQKENKVQNDYRSKMPINVVNALESFFKEGKKLKDVSEYLPKHIQKTESTPLADFHKDSSKKNRPTSKPLKRLQDTNLKR